MLHYWFRYWFIYQCCWRADDPLAYSPCITCSLPPVAVLLLPDKSTCGGVCTTFSPVELLLNIPLDNQTIGIAVQSRTFALYPRCIVEQGIATKGIISVLLLTGAKPVAVFSLPVVFVV